MKPLLPYSLIAAAALCGVALGQTTATTTPVGYTTHGLQQGFNALGLTLHNSAVASGDVDSVNGNVITDSGLSVSPVAGRTYVLEIVSGALTGVIQEVPAASISGTTITTPQSLALAAGDRYKLRLAPTLEEVFGTTPLASGGILQAALSAGTADVVWVPNGDGTYTQYFLHSSTQQFRVVGATVASPNVPLIYPDGFFVQKKSTAAASLTISGEVKTVGTNSVLAQGFNLLSSVAPVGMNLFNAGIEDDIQGALSAGTADIVWVQQADLSYKQYFRHSSTGTWRDVAAPTIALTQAQAEAIQLSTGFLIQRKAPTAVQLDLAVPASYVSL